MANVTVATAQQRIRTAWLYSPRTDLGIMLVPILLVAVIATIAGGNDNVSGRAYGAWLTQFVLGNTTHVILTFLLLYLRRDMLRATKTHQRTIVGGSAGVFVGSLVGFYALATYAPKWSDFGLAIILLLATHHTLSQTRGIWSLYNLRGMTRGFPRPSPLMQSLQRNYAAVGLLLIAVRWLFIPKTSTSMFAFVQSVPLMEAPLPFSTSYALLGVWVVFGGLLLFELTREEVVNASKLAYVGVNVAAVGLCLLAPPWGAILTAGMHGLEYCFLSQRMLQPNDSEPNDRLSRKWVWPIMAASMLPLFAIGLVIAPFAPATGLPPPVLLLLPVLLNAVVLSHYFADAFIYRFRIPEIRKVALARMRFH